MDYQWFTPELSPTEVDLVIKLMRGVLGDDQFRFSVDLPGFRVVFESSTSTVGDTVTFVDVFVVVGVPEVVDGVRVVVVTVVDRVVLVAVPVVVDRDVSV